MFFSAHLHIRLYIWSYCVYIYNYIYIWSRQNPLHLSSCYCSGYRFWGAYRFPGFCVIHQFACGKFKHEFIGTGWSASFSTYCHHHPQRKNLFRCSTMKWNIFPPHSCASSSAARKPASAQPVLPQFEVPDAEHGLHEATSAAMHSVCASRPFLGGFLAVVDSFANCFHQHHRSGGASQLPPL